MTLEVHNDKVSEINPGIPVETTFKDFNIREPPNIVQ